MKSAIEATGALIDAIGTEQFGPALSGALKEIAPFDYTVIFGFLGTAPPLDLFDDFPPQKRKIFVKDYQEGPYLLDPFYLACGNQVTPALYRIRDLAPDRFFQSEYFRNYYGRTGLAEEIGYFIQLDDNSVIVVSLMRAEKPFSAREFRDLNECWPLVRAACQRHWGGLSARFSANGADTSGASMHQNVALAFSNFGEGVLTPRERQVVEYTLKGHSADAVSRVLNISSGTVRIHKRNVYSKLRIKSQGELFSKFIDILVSRDSP